VSDLALAGTRPLLPDHRTLFSDRYAEQYAQSLAWMRRALEETARARDRGRRRDPAWLDERRRLLAARSGAVWAPAEATAVARSPDGAMYAIETRPGVRYAGRMAEPATAPRGLVVVAGRDESETSGLAEQYRAASLRVVVPFFVRAGRSFADHAERRWYHFGDDELLHLFAFVIGGSLAGLEAAELQATVGALGTGPDGRALPRALDLRGRHVLTGVVAAALRPELVDLLVLHEEAERLDHQEADVRVNTIWGFHAAFDGLTLLAMASRADLLFVEPTATPSALYARALAWLGPPRAVERLVAAAPEADALVATVSSRLARRTQPAGPAPVATAEAELPPEEALYHRALESKLAFLEAGHAAAREHRARRYDLASLTPDDYRRRVAEGLASVVGPPPTRAAAPDPRTRLVASRPTHRVYEIVLASVPGVETAGYLLLPYGARPAPAVVCQHGRGGRPESLVGLTDEIEGGWIYDRFAQRLAEKGYVVVAPFMNWGWGSTPARDALVKPAYALGITPNRLEAAQLGAIVDFLAARPEVIADRIAFYGLSYGGHASLWLGADEPRLAAIVTAAYFNEWQTKLTSVETPAGLERPTSYISVDEGYDMFTYGVFNELSHAELATRFAPRPYMVEHGLHDRATPTAWVEREFARVQAVYDWMGALDRCAIEHFDGPHRIWSEASFQFLHRHLRQ
jgi:hypothetical protein